MRLASLLCWVRKDNLPHPAPRKGLVTCRDGLFAASLLANVIQTCHVQHTARNTPACCLMLNDRA